MDVERDIEIKAPVRDVWAILSDIPGYPRWNRSMRLTLDEEGGDLVTFAMDSMTRAGKPHEWRLGGKLRPFREPDQVSWRLGAGVVLMLTMVIDLVPRGADTHARFHLQIKGLVAPFAGRALARLLTEPIAGTLRDLKRAAEVGDGLRPKPARNPRINKPRRRFR